MLKSESQILFIFHKEVNQIYPNILHLIMTYIKKI